MTILDSLGGRPAAVKHSEAPQLSLTPDAETLALFAGLFAMLQQPEETENPGSSLNSSPDAQAVLSGLTSDAPAQGPVTTGPGLAGPGLTGLPAAARLMVDGGNVGDTSSGQSDAEETESLARLLIAAKTLSEGTGDIPTSGSARAPDIALDPTSDMTTAKAILARAIEILDDIDSRPAHQASDAVKDPMIQPADTAEQLIGDESGAPSDFTSGVMKAVQPAPSADFIGPMPAVPVVAQPVTMAVRPAPSADFIGPMPAVPVVAQPVTMAVQPASSADFIGPMPAASQPVTMAVQPAPSAEFIGPMPAVPVVAAPLPAGPMTLSASGTTPTQTTVLSTLSPEFTGPMSTVATSVTAVPKAAVHASSHSALMTEQAQAGQGQPRQGAPLQSGPWQSDIGGATKTGDGMTPTDTGGDQKLTAAAFDQLSKGRRMAKTVDPLRATKTAGGQADLSMTSASAQRDIRAHAEQLGLAGGQLKSGSSSGSSSSGQSSSGTPTTTQNVVSAAGQSGGQAGGQNQSGQGGGQTASQGFADAQPSRDLADRTMLHRLNTANAGWSETMIKRLTSDLRSGVQTVRIILEPRHLGRLNVDLGLRNGRASIRIAAETAGAAKLLGSARGQLGQMLEQSGMRLASFQTSASGQDTAMDGQTGHQGDAQSHANGKNAGSDQGFSNKLVSASGDMRHADDNPDDQGFAPRTGETAVLSVLA